MQIILLNIIGLSALLGAVTARADTLADRIYSTYVSETGEIRLPENFRQNWTHLGSWVVNDSKAPGYGFHDVYTQPEAAEAFRQSGRFPDGAVLVKEIRKIGSGKLTTGEALWATDNAVWFVMVKDSRQRFKDSRHWGDGWGWALFTAEQPDVNSSKGYAESCLSCHSPAKANDWVFVDGYPSLKPSMTMEKRDAQK